MLKGCCMRRMVFTGLQESMQYVKWKRRGRLNKVQYRHAVHWSGGQGG